MRRFLGRHLGQAALVLLLATVAGSVALWVWADHQSKQAELAAGLLGGSVVGLAVLAIQRRFDAAQARRDSLSRFVAGGEGVDHTGQDLSGAQVQAKNLAHSTFVRCDLRKAWVDFSNLTRANFRDADLDGATVAHCSLIGADLGGASLRGCDLEFSSLQSAELPGCDLTATKLGGADLRWANLSDAVLRGCDFVGRGPGGPLWAADLRHALLYGADLTGARLVAADRSPEQPGEVVGVDLTEAMANERTRWPVGFDPVAAGVTVLPGDSRKEHEPAWTDPGADDVTATAASWNARLSEYTGAGAGPSSTTAEEILTEVRALRAQLDEARKG